MDASSFDGLLDWIAAHPGAAGAVVFAIALCDSLIIVGAIVPALPLLFAVGVLIGLGELSGPYAVASAALGALAGDAVSFWVGHRWGPALRGHWPFSRYPQLLGRGETLFRRNAFKAILVARYVGPIRPFVPAVAGMLHMPLRRYLPASALAAVSWALLFLAPGWLLGQAYDAVAAVAGRLTVVLALMLLAVAAAWALVVYVYRWFASHADSLSARALRWSRAHPAIGGWSQAVFDPRRRESTSLLVLGALLLGAAWLCFWFLVVVLGHGGPLGMDVALFELMHGLRNPLADRPLAAIAALGDAQVLGPAALAVLAWLAWRRRWLAAAHWLAAIGFGVVLTVWLGAMIHIPKPPTVTTGFGFPSVAVTMTTIIFGFFAVLVARELPGRDRVWPYVVAGVVVAAVGFARLYLGAHWLSDVLGGSLLGIVWLLALGIAYRRRTVRSLWMKPLAWLFYSVFALAGLWHAPRSVDATLARFDPPAAQVDVALGDWWAQAWAGLPAQRSEFDDTHRWPLDVQVAGPLQPLRQRLLAAGWHEQPQAGWERTLQLLRADLPVQAQPVLPATLDTRAETLLMLRPGARPGDLVALRLWATPWRLQPGDEPLWIGSAQTLRHHRILGLAGLWRPVAESPAALRAVEQALGDLPARQDPHPQTGLPVLRVRTDAAGGLRPSAPASGPGAHADRPPAGPTAAAHR